MSSYRHDPDISVLFVFRTRLSLLIAYVDTSKQFTGPEEGGNPGYQMGFIPIGAECSVESTIRPRHDAGYFLGTWFPTFKVMTGPASTMK